MCANISGKSPLTEPYFEIELLGVLSIIFVIITELLCGIHILIPSLVIMVIHYNLVDIWIIF
jgi:hypothetical protein